MSDIKITDNTDAFLTAFDKAIRNGLEAIGMTAETYAKKRITDNESVVTGRLRNSITYAISGKKSNIDTYTDDEGNLYSYSGTAPNDKQLAVYIGTNVEYAGFVELGTSRSKPYPFLKPAATEHAEEYRRIFKAALDSAK